MEPATRAAQDYGCKVILYGHTHLAKQIPIADTDAVYLNTGTWANLMCVPDSILLPDLAAEGERQLAVLAEDLRSNRLERWTSHMPTFARIEMEAGRTREAQLLIWKGNGSFEQVPAGRLSRLLVNPEKRADK